MMVDRISIERRSWNMSRIRSRDTKPELLLRSALHKTGFRFRLHVRKLPGCPDIVLPRYRTVIFVHGCFWHRHSGCRNASIPSNRRDFWIGKLDANVERDEKNNVALKASGWTVFTVWECELESDPETVLHRLSHALKGIG